MEKKIGVFAGTFDPITIGHEEVIKKASELFDSLVVAICINEEKHTMFGVETRLEMVKTICKKYKNCSAVYHEGMLVDLMKEIGAKYYIRGVRNIADFEYESKMHFFNKKLYKDLITIFIPCDEELSSVSSTNVRDAIKNGGDLKEFLPLEVLEIIKDKL